MKHSHEPRNCRTDKKKTGKKIYQSINRCITLCEHACVLLASYRSWTQRDLMLYTSSLTIIQCHMKNENKIHLLSVPAFKDQWTENVGEKTVVALLIRRRRKTMLNLATSEGHVPRKALTNGFAILQLSVFLTFHHFHIGPLFVTGFSK